jgi:hypothetical protein
MYLENTNLTVTFAQRLKQKFPLPAFCHDFDNCSPVYHISNSSTRPDVSKRDLHAIDQFFSLLMQGDLCSVFCPVWLWLWWWSFRKVWVWLWWWSFRKQQLDIHISHSWPGPNEHLELHLWARTIESTEVCIQCNIVSNKWDTSIRRTHFLFSDEVHYHLLGSLILCHQV